MFVFEAAKQSPESQGMGVGPIRHTNLAPELVDRIRRLEAAFAEFYPMSHEEWLDGLQRDQSLENEVAIWEQMALAYTVFLKQSKLEAGGRREALGLLIRSRSGNVESRIGSLRHLTIAQAKSLLDLYTAPPKPITFKDAVTGETRPLQ